MADDSGIDPRYAPHFQRGFDPMRHVPAPARPAPARRGPVRLEGGPPPTAPRVPDPPRMAPILPVEETPDALTPTHAEEFPPPTALTWWDWLLPGVGAAFIAISLLLWWRLGTDTTQYYGSAGTDEWAIFLQQLPIILPGPLLTAGVLAVTGGLVLQAGKIAR